MTYPWITPLLAAVASLALAVLVARRGQRSDLTRSFVLMATVLVFWNLNFFVLYSVSDARLAFKLSRICRTVTMFVPPAILQLILAARSRKSRFWGKVLMVDYFLSALLAVANSLDLVVSDIRRAPWGFVSVYTPLVNVFTTLTIVNFTISVALLIRDYRTCTEPRTRVQIKFWLAGALIAVPLGLTNLLPAYGIPFYPLGNLGIMAWAGVVAYAILRHRLMDVDVVVTKGAAYGAVSLILIAPAFALALWLQTLSFGQIHPDFSFAILLMLVAVGVLFPTLRLRAQSRLEQSLFREKHAHRAALDAFARSLVRILDRERLTRELAATLIETLNLDRVAVALLNEGKRVLAIRHAVGTAPVDNEFSEKDGFVRALRRRREVALREELEAAATADERPAVTAACNRNGWEVCIPLTAGPQLCGFIGLGRKRSLEAFFANDLDLLGTLAAQASIALENARLYEELKRSQEIIRRSDRLSALGTLAAGIAHEVRNPLVSIQTFFQLAPERLHDEEFLTKFLDLTANEVKRISTLIDELLSFARSPTRALQPTDLNEIAERVVTLLEGQAHKAQVTLTHQLSASAPPVLADADQIKQVLINIVLNAVQATPPRGAVTVISRPAELQHELFGQLEVRDTGVGIPADALDSIFNPFFTTKDKGTGLGLTIAHQIVTEHGGVLTLESTEGRGTSFFIALPAAAAATLVEPAAADLASEFYDRPRKVASS
jgi:two-component system NtrC family sensor kinase